MINTYSQNIVASKKKANMVRIINDCKDLIKNIEEIIFKSIFFMIPEMGQINNNEMTQLLEPFFKSEMLSNKKVSEIDEEQLQSIIDEVVSIIKKLNKVISDQPSQKHINKLLNSLMESGKIIYEIPLAGSDNSGKSLFDYNNSEEKCFEPTNNGLKKRLVSIVTTVLEQL